jgi:GNAT superfamily N-acetyltransferase
VTASTAPLADAAVAQCIDRLREVGYRSVVTNAMAEPEQSAFVAHGFTVRARLRLLSLELRAEPVISTPIRVDHVGRHEHDRVLALDEAAFDASWQLGPIGLRDALDATPTRQLRASRGPGGRDDHTGPELTGYAITGKAGTDGYLQRIAVAPDAQGHGYGRALVDDALHFLWREGADRAYVNTQLDNDRARTLYESCGFSLRPNGLCVLERSL